MHTLRLITWNVYEGHKPDDVLAALTKLVEDHNPDVLVLQECSFQDKLYAVPGYRVFHKPLDHPGHGVRGEDADSAVLVRADIAVRRHRWRKMKMSWKGPDHGIPHEPRVYQTMLLGVRGRTWKLGGGHWPFGRAQLETKAWVIAWFRSAMPKRPTVYTGDLNCTVRGLARVLWAAGAKAAGHRIDLAIYRNCRVKDEMALPMLGSDHHAVLIDLEAR